MLAAMTVDLTAILVALLGGGFFSGLIAMTRMKVDKDAVIVTAAQGAVTVQSGVLLALQAENGRLQAENGRLEADLIEARDESQTLRLTLTTRNMRIDQLEQMLRDAHIQN